MPTKGQSYQPQVEVTNHRVEVSNHKSRLPTIGRSYQPQVEVTNSRSELACEPLYRVVRKLSRQIKLSAKQSKTSLGSRNKLKHNYVAPVTVAADTSVQYRISRMPLGFIFFREISYFRLKICNVFPKKMCEKCPINSKIFVSDYLKKKYLILPQKNTLLTTSVCG